MSLSISLSSICIHINKYLYNKYLYQVSICICGLELGVFVGPGRGSAPGSVVAYCIGITNIDPIKYNLLFERFLNPDRPSAPDIDLDFADTRRDEVIEYVKSR